jgi:hypothetical protein
MKKPAPFTTPLVIKLASHKQPEAKQVTGKDWVYWGDKNDYFEFLKDIFYKASKHNAIVNGKTKYIAGGGWGDAGNTFVNSENEKLDKLTWKCTLDLELYGGFCMEVIWTNGGKKAEYRHVDFAAVRTNADQTKYYYTKGWLTKSGSPHFDPRQNKDWTEYEPFDPNNRGEAQLLYYKNYCPGLDVYPKPEYQASVLFIELEYQIANYWYNRVKNGFMPSAILNFYMSQPSDDEMDKLEEKIKGKLAGTNNAGQFIMNFAANKDSAADIQQITPPELGQEYEALNTTLQTEIFTGHGVTSGMLFGIKEAGQLGGRTELIEANELFQNRYVNPKQAMLEQFYAEYVFPYIGVSEAYLKKQEPIGYMFSESIIVKYLPERAIAEMVALKMGIDLKEYPEYEKERAEKKAQEQKANVRFKSDRDKAILERLKRKGKKRKGEVIYSRPVTFEMSKDLKASEEEVRMNFAKQKNPIIIGGGVPLGPMPTITDSPTEVISFVYTYEWAEGFSDSDIATSRDFCVEMREQTLDGVTWTREDIEGEDNGTELSVWESRGGWFNDNGVAVPRCRHIFMQKLLREIQ